MAYNTGCKLYCETEKKSIGSIKHKIASCSAFYKGPIAIPKGYCDNCPVIAALEVPHCIYLQPAWVVSIGEGGKNRQEGYFCTKQTLLGKNFEQCFNDPGTCDDYAGE